MQLTNQNIRDLYKFTRQHYVEHYDVQTELVDHLANDIEDICKENPNISFEQARDKSFKKFGVFGFMNVVEQKQRQVSKRYRKIIWQFTKEWFELPKIVATLAIFLFFYCCLLFKTGVYILGVTIGILVILDTYYAIKIKKEFNKRFKKNGKKWVLEEYIFNVASFGTMMVASNVPQFLNFTLKETHSQTVSIAIALLITVTIIYSYVALIVIPKKSDELLEKEYPEYKLV